jgi:hypothetical protein
MQQTNLMPPNNSNNQNSQTTTITLTSPPNSRHLSGDLQQIQQNQQQSQAQPIYYMYQDTQMDSENAPIEFEGHVAHTAQAAPITVNEKKNKRLEYYFKF